MREPIRHVHTPMGLIEVPPWERERLAATSDAELAERVQQRERDGFPVDPFDFCEWRARGCPSVSAAPARESRLARMRAIADEIERARIQIADAMHGLEHNPTDETRPRYEAALVEAKARRSKAYEELATLVGGRIGAAPAGDSDEDLARHHPAVQATAAVNPTFSTRVARARTN